MQPESEDSVETDDSIITEVSELFDSHLLCHSDCEGFYVPVDFEDVIFDDNLPGCMLGSSQRLLSDIADIAGFIGINLQAGSITEQQIAELQNIDEDDPFYMEKEAWFSLYEHAVNSIENKTVIAFC